MTARSTEEVVDNSCVTAAVAATLFDALARALLKNRLETEMTDELDSNQRASMAREMMALLCRIAPDGGVDVPLGGPLLPVIEALWGANPVKDVMAIPMPDFTRTVGPATAAQQHAAAYYTQQVVFA